MNWFHSNTYNSWFLSLIIFSSERLIRFSKLTLRTKVFTWKFHTFNSHIHNVRLITFFPSMNQLMDYFIHSFYTFLKFFLLDSQWVKPTFLLHENFTLRKEVQWEIRLHFFTHIEVYHTSFNGITYLENGDKSVKVMRQLDRSQSCFQKRTNKRFHGLQTRPL